MTDTVNNSTTYLWYDYETFGTEARKDRPVQYGSFRTDTNFNIIGQSMVLYAQLADDYIPSPGSSLVTGITPMSLMDEENALPISPKSSEMKWANPARLRSATTIVITTMR
jgi:exonuclease I